VASFSEGVNTDITLCPEHMAASLFTAQTSPLEVSRTMNKQIEEALAKLTEGNPELYATLAEKIDATNRTVSADGSIIKRITTQETTGTAQAATQVETPVEVPTVVETPVQPVLEAPVEKPAAQTQFVADDAFVGEVTRSVLGSEAFTAALGDAVTRSTAAMIERVQTELLAPLTAQVEALSTAIAAAQTQVENRVKALELPEAERKQAYLRDLPARKVPEVQVTYRPRSQQAQVEAKKTPLADAASSTLEAIRSKRTGVD
jgi:hypothetical protein